MKSTGTFVIIATTFDSTTMFVIGNASVVEPKSSEAADGLRITNRVACELVTQNFIKEKIT